MGGKYGNPKSISRACAPSIMPLSSSEQTAVQLKEQGDALLKAYKLVEAKACYAQVFEINRQLHRGAHDAIVRALTDHRLMIYFGVNALMRMSLLVGSQVFLRSLYLLRPLFLLQLLFGPQNVGRAFASPTPLAFSAEKHEKQPLKP